MVLCVKIMSKELTCHQQQAKRGAIDCSREDTEGEGPRNRKHLHDDIHLADGPQYKYLQRGHSLHQRPVNFMPRMTPVGTAGWSTYRVLLGISEKHIPLLSKLGYILWWEVFQQGSILCLQQVSVSPKRLRICCGRLYMSFNYLELRNIPDEDGEEYSQRANTKHCD